ncbi:histidine phosphatase family protein [Lentilactobacillus kosonis]|uniref:Predicted broad substrate specificity phosphatase n=1 Tax=Lentilactobacillus kosonis TaxID=2810561 RepID=A0A401FIY9_9LACO|nr:histidine phosphatase family protein [Lentilactobacillus kosonis]GAY72333.1 predicted broad substrate specificity phosphatase [Lentilactobacillus kosonis]
MTNFYFVRHGQTAANKAGLKQGIVNTEITNLNDVGRQQANQLHDHFEISFADLVIASPLQRTIDTANILNQAANLEVVTDDRLLEISYGDWDGQTNASLQSNFPDLFDPVLNDVLPAYAAIANGETFQQVIYRVKQFMMDYAKQFPTGNLIVVTHGFTVKAAVLAATNNDDDLMSIEEPANCSVTKITYDETNENYYVRYFNRISRDEYK